MLFFCIADALEHPIAGVQHRSVWLGLKCMRDKCDVCVYQVCVYVCVSNCGMYARSVLSK